MIIGTAQITRTQINVKLHEEYAKLNVNSKEQQNNIKQNKDYIELNSQDTSQNNYAKILEQSKNNIEIPKDPDLAIARLSELRKSSDSNINNKNIVMGMNLMKMKLQLQTTQTNPS